MIEFTATTLTSEGIAVEKRAFLEKKLAKMNRRLAKLGAPAATLTFGPIIERSRKDEITGLKFTWREFETVTVTGVEARHGGWRPVASLDHTYGAEPIVSKFPGAIEDEIALPDSYRASTGGCDHCGLGRERNLTIVFIHDDGRFIEVGTSCVLEFIGVDPNTVLWLRESFASTFDDDDEPGGYAAEEFIGPFEFLAVAAELTAAVGFVPSKSEDGWSTKDRATALIFGRGKERKAAEVDGFDIDRGRAAAETIAEWINSPAAGSGDFILDARTALRASKAGYRTYGLLAALPFVFAKATTEAAEAANAKPSEFVGSVGDRLIVNVTITAAIRVETNFGMSIRLNGLTEDGDKITTFGSGNDLFRVDVGDIVEWTGTITEHEDHPKYGKATVTKRVKLAEPATPLDSVKLAVKGDMATTFADRREFGWDGGVLLDSNTVTGAVTAVTKRAGRFTYSIEGATGYRFGHEIEVKVPANA